ncbi:MAG: GerMN domain-containing protein [Pseudanabaenaceae cyanobacterium]
MATQPWWSVRLEQWRAAWQTQRYSPKNTFKKVNNNSNYRPSYQPNFYDRKSSKTGLWLTILLCLIAGAAISAVIWQISHTNPTGQPTSNPTSNNDVVSPTTIPAATKPSSENYTVAKPGQLAVYWILNEGKQLRAIPVSINPPKQSTSQPNTKQNNSGELDRFALEQLLSQQPPASKLKNAIPSGTKLLEFRREVTPEGTNLWINLSREFTQGGGSASMQGRLVQLVYTATISSPDAAVYINVAGEPLTILGGEGLILNQPTRRQDLSLQF